jgi:hypothetical protein
MPAPQTFKNHAKFDPPFHFFVIPLLLANLVYSIVATTRWWSIVGERHHHIWWIVMSVALLALAGVARMSALRAQDRVIRLEEHLRYHRLLPDQAHERYAALSLRQIIALRFASNEELPALSARAVAENLTPKQIKQSITTWRPDTYRV